MTTQAIQEIRSLLAAYYDGSTDPGQEERLRRLLNEADTLPADLRTERDIMNALTAVPEADMPSQLAPALNIMIERMYRQESHIRRGRRLTSVIAIAASVILIATLSLIFVRSFRTSPYEITDPEAAFAKTTHALELVAGGLRSTDRYVTDTSAKFILMPVADDDSISEDENFDDNANEYNNDSI